MTQWPKTMKDLPTILFCFLLSVPGFAQLSVSVTGGDDSGRPQIDIESYYIEATIDPVERELIASVEVRFIQLDRQSYAVFDLDRRLRVRDVYLGEEEPIPVRFRQFDIDSTFEVDLSDLGQFDQPLIRVEYDGILNPEESRREPILARVSSDSAFLLHEAKWFPLNGVQQDAAMMDLHLTMPPDWQVVSGLSDAGSRLEDFETGAVRRSLRGAVPSFWGTIAAGPYEAVSLPPGDGPEVEVLVFGDSLEAAAEMGEAASEAFAFYAERFGEGDHFFVPSG